MFIYTMTRPFVGEFDTIQLNTFRAWQALGLDMAVFCERSYDALYMRDTLGFDGITGVRTNSSAIPLVNAIIALGETLGLRNYHDTFVCANADNIFLPDFLTAIPIVAAKSTERRFNGFCAVGRRTNLDVAHKLDFTAPAIFDELADAAKKAQSEGHLASYHAVDWFAYLPAGLFGDVPDFAIGRGQYDCWLLNRAVEAGALVVDVTDAVTVIHQNHSPATATSGRWGEESAMSNRELAGDAVMGINETPFVMTAEGEIVERG